MSTVNDGNGGPMPGTQHGRVRGGDRVAPLSDQEADVAVWLRSVFDDEQLRQMYTYCALQQHQSHGRSADGHIEVPPLGRRLWVGRDDRDHEYDDDDNLTAVYWEHLTDAATWCRDASKRLARAICQGARDITALTRPAVCIVGAIGGAHLVARSLYWRFTFKQLFHLYTPTTNTFWFVALGIGAAATLRLVAQKVKDRHAISAGLRFGSDLVAIHMSASLARSLINAALLRGNDVKNGFWLACMASRSTEYKPDFFGGYKAGLLDGLTIGLASMSVMAGVASFAWHASDVLSTATHSWLRKKRRAKHTLLAAARPPLPMGQAIPSAADRSVLGDESMSSDHATATSPSSPIPLYGVRTPEPPSTSQTVLFS